MNVEQLAKIVSGRVVGDGSVEITGVSDIRNAKAGDVTFAMTRAHAQAASACPASVVLVLPGVPVEGKPAVEVKNPKYSFIQVLWALGPKESEAPGIHPSAWVSPEATVSDGAAVGAGATVEAGADLADGVQVLAGARVGRGSRLGPGAAVHRNAVLYPGTVLGRGAVVHGGAVIGADGFGYLQEGKAASDAEEGAIVRYRQAPEPHLKVPHFGHVILGDEVEVGANTTIDRGTVGPTVIGRGSKIDNLVQIGHNCVIGEHVIIVGMVGLGGSVTVGDHVTIGGNTGVSEGVTLGEFTIVGAHTLVFPGKRFEPHSVVWGNPARPARKFRAQLAALSSLPRRIRKMRDLESRVLDLAERVRRLEDPREG